MLLSCDLASGGPKVNNWHFLCRKCEIYKFLGIKNSAHHQSIGKQRGVQETHRFQ
jgi:hypothetical protein